MVRKRNDHLKNILSAIYQLRKKSGL